MVELMVAITGGLFVAIAVFSLASHSSGFYHQETRVASATMSTVVGFERLRADIARASFLSSPNVRDDPNVCGEPATDAQWPAYLNRLQGVFIEPDQLIGHPLLDSTTNGNIRPDRITLAGSYASVDQFPVYLIEPGSSGDVIYLQQNVAPMARADGDIQSIFQVGRGVRIVDKSGKHHYGTIASSQNGGGTGQPQITLTAQPSLNYKGSTPLACGLKGFETGALVNVINIVEYSLLDLTNAAAFPEYAPIFDDGSTDPDLASTSTYDWAGDPKTRLELARRELNTTGTVIPNTTELIAELAVDLAFGITVRTDTVGNDQQTLSFFPENNAGVATWAGNVATNNATDPQRLRTVRARLAVRSREPDRKSALPGGLYRFEVTGDPNVNKQKWARVRTLQADIALHNQIGVTW